MKEQLGKSDGLSEKNFPHPMASFNYTTISYLIDGSSKPLVSLGELVTLPSELSFLQHEVIWIERNP